MGLYSREKGVRAERKYARKFREAGFICERVLEYDGRSHGVDLRLGIELRPFSKDHPQIRYWLPVAIQVKATECRNDLFSGLEECILGAPNAKLWACLHSHKRKLDIFMSMADTPFRWAPTWDELIERIRKLSPLRPTP